MSPLRKFDYAIMVGPLSVSKPPITAPLRIARRSYILIPCPTSSTAGKVPLADASQSPFPATTSTSLAKLLSGAVETLKAAGLPDDAIDVAWVPGAWELPLVAQRFAEAGSYAAVLCLGAVIKGETTHDEHINRQVSLSLGAIALKTASRCCLAC